MLRDKARVILMSLALGLVAAGGFYAFTKGRGLFTGSRGAGQAVAARTVPVVVAVKDISRRTKITPEMLKVVQMPEGVAHPEAISDVKSAEGFFTEEKLLQGEVLLKPNLSKIKAPGELSYSVPAGKRAVTVSVSPAAGVGNMLRPGDRVDVLAHVGDKVAGQDVVFLLIENSMVLATDSRTGLEKEKAVDKVADGPAEAKEYRTVTLAVTPKEGSMLDFAESVGEIKLVLHGAGGEYLKGFKGAVSPAVVADTFGFKLKEEEAGGGGTRVAAAPPASAAPVQYQAPVAAVQAPVAATQPAAEKAAPDPKDLIYVMRGSELTAVEGGSAGDEKKNSISRGGVK